MDREELFSRLTYEYVNDDEELGMILSNNIDIGSSEGAMISGRAFSGLIEDIKRWRMLKNRKMRKGDKIKINPKCNFCGADNAVHYITGKNGACICNDCIATCCEICTEKMLEMIEINNVIKRSEWIKR